LTKLGLRAFLSEISLPRLGDTAFLKAIDGALECARHLLVVATSRTSIDSSWVDSEWRIFVGLKHSGRKSGNVLTVMGGQLTVRDLPPALSQYEAIRIESPDLESRLADFLR
jgi:hypothetical protein